jgi:hypothetical protein
MALINFSSTPYWLAAFSVNMDQASDTLPGDALVKGVCFSCNGGCEGPLAQPDNNRAESTSSLNLTPFSLINLSRAQSYGEIRRTKLPFIRIAKIRWRYRDFMRFFRHYRDDSSINR